MTALAMIIGMVPMALGLGEGGEQNAPLGRAVIGGLMLATVATLFFVPAVFALLHGRRRARRRARSRSEIDMSQRDGAARPSAGAPWSVVVLLLGGVGDRGVGHRGAAQRARRR